MTDNAFIEGLKRYLSDEDLTTIQSTAIGIGGAGGLGSNVAMMLVRSGFEKLEIIDQDMIDASNLNRQQYFLNEIGQSKVETLAKRLQAINPRVQIKTHHQTWTEDMAGPLFHDCNIVVEAFDQADWKFRFMEYYREHKQWVVSGNGMAGLRTKSPLQQKKIGNVFIIGDGTTDTAAGHPPMAPRVTACAAMMAEMVLDLTLDIAFPN